MDTLPFHLDGPRTVVSFNSLHLSVALVVSNGEEAVTIDHLIELFHGLLYSNMATTTTAAHPDVWTAG